MGFFSKSDGFLPVGQIKKYKPLPPRLHIQFDPPKKKEKKPPLVSSSKTPQMILDIECFWNYFLIKFRRVSDNKLFNFERLKDAELDYDAVESILKKYEIVTFNGNVYDVLVLRLALTGATNKELKKATNEIIQENLTPYNFEQKYDLPKTNIKHIDIVGLLPGVGISLKVYGGRLHCEKMQDLPFHEDTTLTDDEMDDTSEYCGNDLEVTHMLLDSLSEQIELRRVMSKKYKLDLLSKSDAQIAEAVIKSEILKTLPKGEKIKKPEIKERSFYYRAPDFISFTNNDLLDALDITETKPFDIGSNGKITMPKELSVLKIKIGKSIYSMGMGGLHSTEKRAFHISDENFTLYDWDVDSYYPKIIIICGIYPKHLGKIFLDIFGVIVDERLAAKIVDDMIKAGTLKIVVNGSFGKLGSPYSILYAPELMVQVTVTGQLSLLMLIDLLERRGISVVSGNTDGVVIKCPKGREAEMRSIIEYWQKKTGFKMSEAKYAGLWSKDVNNYIAIKYDGSAKLKGNFSPAGLSKNPSNEICTMAMIEYLKFGTPFEKTIKACTDIRKFVNVGQVQGGAIKDGKYLGKAIRWYYAKGEKTAIHRRTNNDKVASTDGAKPIMTLPKELPKDIDYDWYINRCRELF